MVFVPQHILVVGDDGQLEQLVDPLRRVGHIVTVASIADGTLEYPDHTFDPTQSPDIIILNSCTRVGSGQVQMSRLIAQLESLTERILEGCVLLLRGRLALGTGRFVRDWLDARGFTMLSVAVCDGQSALIATQQELRELVIGCDGPWCELRLEQLRPPAGPTVGGGVAWIVTDLETAEFIALLQDVADEIRADVVREFSRVACSSGVDLQLANDVLRRALSVESLFMSPELGAAS